MVEDDILLTNPLACVIVYTLQYLKYFLAESDKFSTSQYKALDCHSKYKVTNDKLMKICFIS